MLFNFENKELCQIVDLFYAVFNKFARIDKKARDFGTGDLLYHAEIHTIASIAENPEINITDLAYKLGVTKGAVSQTVKKLEDKQLIARFKGEDDREVSLRLSDKGVVANKGHNDLMRSRFVIYEKLFNEASEKERNTVKKVIEAINNQFDEFLECDKNK